MQAEEKKYDIFISYRRDGGEYTAKVLRDHLNERNYNVFFDIESLRSGDFNTKLYSVIEECTDFLLVLSPGALDRCSNPDDWVRKEIEYALEKRKNIVPVMLRGFEFPDQLPPAIEPVRFKNGLQGSTQFFDAFMNKLCTQFLQSKPGKKSGKSRKILIAAILVCALAAGIVLGVSGRKKGFPNSREERNLTDQFLYCVEQNLAQISLSYKSFNNMIQAGKRFISSGEKDRRSLETEIEVAKNGLQKLEGARVQPSDQLMAGLAKTPVSTSDFIAMYNETEIFRNDLLDRIEILSTILLSDESVVIPSSSKLAILQCYENYYSETIKAYSLCANGLLLPVRDDALESFWYEFLPEYSNLGLTAGGWLRDNKDILAGLDVCDENMNQAILDLTRETSKIGYESVDILAARLKAMSTSVEQQKELTARMLYLDEASELNLRIEHSKNAGWDTADLERRRNILIAAAQDTNLVIGDVREKYGAKEGDSADLLYEKLKILLAFHYDSAALECLDAFAADIEETEPELFTLVPDIRLFIESIKETGYRYGMIVLDVNLIDPPNEVLKTGDIIVEFNSKDCFRLEDYIAAKAELPDGGSYTVTVLRKNDAGKLEPQRLQLTKDMPPVYMTQLSECGTALPDEETEKQAPAEEQAPAA